MSEKISDESIANAGPDTLRRMLSMELQRNQKMQEILQFARLAIKSANGNMIALDTRIADLFKEVVPK